MKTILVLLLLHCVLILVSSEEGHTKDIEDSEDLERRHRKRKKGQNAAGPCGYGGGGGGGHGHGKTFGLGEKLFGLQEYTYVSAPVMNYFFGCGVAALPVAAPVAPIAPVATPVPLHPYPYPVNIGVSQSQNHHHGGHHGGFGGHGGFGHQGRPGNFGGYNQGFNQQPFFQSDYNNNYNQGAYQRPYYNNRPFQNVVSAAASGLGTALADYITTRPKKTYKQINKQVNQVLKPFFKLF